MSGRPTLREFQEIIDLAKAIQKAQSEDRIAALIADRGWSASVKRHMAMMISEALSGASA